MILLVITMIILLLLLMTTRLYIILYVINGDTDQYPEYTLSDIHILHYSETITSCMIIVNKKAIECY